VIPPYTVASILEASRIEEVVSDFVNLKRRGSNLIGLCPFHQEKTPSFTVSPSKGIFKCFGCGKAGDSARFIMEHEHYSYPEALRYLAAKYQIEIEEREQSPEELQEQNERERLFNLNSFARDYFSNSLFETQEGKAIGLGYLKERDFRETVVRKFQLGFNPDHKDAFSNHARNQGYSAEALLKTGLSVGSEDKLYDRFQGRVIFPIHNLTGKVIGFGGRILVSDKTKAKYLNSPESDIYNKSKSLYGLYFAKTAISRLDQCLLVEGYTDVISMHQAGIENVVASSGTSLTTEQIRLIRRYTNNITILYDGDKAGVNASLRGIDMILEEGMNVRVLLFPEGDDPDSFVRKHRSSEVEEFIRKESKDFISFKTGLLLEEAAGDPIRKAGLIREIVTTISLIPDPIYRTVYVKECSRMLEVAEATLMNELNKLLRSRFRKQLSPETPVLPQSQPDLQLQEVAPEQEIPTLHQERELIRLMLMFGNHEVMVPTVDEDGFPAIYRLPLAHYILDDLRNDQLTFMHPTNVKILEIYIEGHDEGVVPHEQHFVSNPEPDVALLCIDLITERYQLSQNWEKHKIFVKTATDDLKLLADSALIHFKRKMVDSSMADLFQQLKEAVDPNDQLIIQKKIKGLKVIDMKLSQKPGIVISK
jgi:DNA primase